MIKTFSPQEVSNQHTAIILLNHGGSSVIEDTGRDAQYIANACKLPVIAADRPSSAFDIFGDKLNTKNYGEHMTALAMKLRAHNTDDNGKVTYNTLIATGRSAGGLGALALAKYGILGGLPINYVYAAEPVGCFVTTPKDGKQHWKQYLAKQSAAQHDSVRYPELIKPFKDTTLMPWHHAKRLGTMLINNLIDHKLNGNLWSNPVAINIALDLAKHTNIYTRIDFAQTSMVAKPNTIAKLREQIQGHRQGDKAPFTVEQPNNTTHASFDNRIFFVKRLQKIVDAALCDNTPLYSFPNR